MSTSVRAPVARFVARVRALPALSTAKLCMLLFAASVVIFHVNRTVVEEGDAIANIDLPLSLLSRGTLSFDPEYFPELFKWKSKAPLIVSEEFFVRRWHHRLGDKTMRDWKDQGYLKFNGPRYNVIESKRRNTFVSTFGPIPGLTLVPLNALLLQLDPDFGKNPLLVLTAAKLHASLLVAATVVLVFLMVLSFTRRGPALLLAAAYGFGTCAWSIASQNIWQQTVNTLFLCLGIVFFLRVPQRTQYAAISALALGAAMACRATSAIVLVAVALYLLRYHRKASLYFALGMVPVPAAIGFYNWYYFGSPISFGQEVAGHLMAMEKTGNPQLWQTPLLQGALGLLVSPSRGLLIFSPFLAIAGYGIVRIWRDQRYHLMRPLTVAALTVMIMQCKWFDWWGGWTYGYRPWLDMIPFLVLFIVPALEWIWVSRMRQGLFYTAIAWSCFVQLIGAFAYDKTWNDRQVFVVELPDSRPLLRLSEANAIETARARGGKYTGPVWCNIDWRDCRRRLWSHEDNIIGYYISDFGTARKRRYESAWGDLAVFRSF